MIAKTITLLELSKKSYKLLVFILFSGIISSSFCQTVDKIRVPFKERIHNHRSERKEETNPPSQIDSRITYPFLEANGKDVRERVIDLCSDYVYVLLQTTQGCTDGFFVPNYIQNTTYKVTNINSKQGNDISLSISVKYDPIQREDYTFSSLELTTRHTEFDKDGFYDWDWNGHMVFDYITPEGMKIWGDAVGYDDYREEGSYYLSIKASITIYPAIFEEGYLTLIGSRSYPGDLYEAPNLFVAIKTLILHEIAHIEIDLKKDYPEIFQTKSIEDEEGSCDNFATSIYRCMNYNYPNRIGWDEELKYFKKK